jgi:Allene oxide cyclase barrel like domain
VVRTEEGGGDVLSKRAAVAAVVTLGMLVLSSGTAVADGRGKGKQREDTLRLVATTIQEEFVDLGAAGPTLGDMFVFSEVLRERGREVGTSGGVCTITEAVPPYTVITFHCVATLSLRRGQITLQGLIEVQGEDDPGPFTVAITGGTGRYRGASGEAVIRDVSDMRTVYKLSFDDDDKKKKRKRGKH